MLALIITFNIPFGMGYTSVKGVAEDTFVPEKTTKPYQQYAYTAADFDLDKCEASYGFAQLLNHSNGEKRQELYKLLIAAAKKVHSENNDITNTAEVDGEAIYYAEKLDFSALGLNIDEALETWSVFRNCNPVFYWISNTVMVTETEIMLTVATEYISGNVRANNNKILEAALQSYEELTYAAISNDEKVILVHDKLCGEMVYARDVLGEPAKDVWAHNVMGVFDNKKAVCEGYAKAFQLILTYLGIESIYVTGTASSGGASENHAWNLVKLDDGEWHAIDTTWDDTAAEDGFTYLYFGLGKDKFVETHTANTPDSGRLEFLCTLPAISNKTLAPVILYKNGIYMTMAADIASALALMTDADAEYKIVLNSNTNRNTLPTGNLPTVKKITFEGNYKDMGNGTFHVDEMYVDGTTTVNSIIEFANIDVRIDDAITSKAKIALGTNKMIFSGEYCRMYADITDGKEGSVIDISVNYFVEFRGNITADTIEAHGNMYNLMGTSYEINKYIVKDGATEIMGNMVSPFASIKEVTIPASVRVIAPEAFNSNTSLIKINVASGNARYISIDGVLYSKTEEGDIDALVRYPAAKSGDVYKTVYTTKEIGNFAFLNAVNLKTVYIYTYADSIGGSAFRGTTSLEKVYIPFSVKSITTNTFDEDTKAVIYAREDAYASFYANAMKLKCEPIAEYTYKFRHEDGSLIYDRTDYEGEMIIEPETPVKPSTTFLVYDFTGWDGGYTEGMMLSEDMEFTATFKERVRTLIYTFFDAYGEIVKTEEVPVGTVIVAPEGEYEKETDAQYIYEFAGWEGFTEGMTISDNINFVPKYNTTTRQYTYTFYAEDGVSVLLTNTVDYGTAILTPKVPVKPVKGDYRYVFTGWSGYTDGMTVIGNAEFKATYKEELNTFTYIFYAEDGVTEVYKETALYGSEIKYCEPPIKDLGDGVSYIFTGWIGYAGGMRLTEDITFTASYGIFEDPVKATFKSDDGSVLYELIFERNSVITLPDVPKKEPTVELAYTFEKWEGYTEGMQITEDISFNAVFTSSTREYTVTFYDEDRVTVVLEQRIPYGEAIIPPEHTKESTIQYDYTLVRWENYEKDMLVTGDLSCYAVFYETLRMYTYKFLDYDEAVIKEFSDYYGAVIAAPPNPTRRGYVFKGWSGLVYGMVLEGDVTFVAEYELFEIEIISDIYKYDESGNYLLNIAPETSFADFVKNTQNVLEIKLFDANGTELTDEAALIGTDMVAKLIAADGSVLQQLILIVKGDTNGDGDISITDFVQIKKQILSNGTHLFGSSLMAADYNDDGKVSITDFVQVKKYILAN